MFLSSVAYGILGLGAPSSPLGLPSAASNSGAVGAREWLLREARRLSLEPHRDLDAALPEPYSALGYDGYRALRAKSSARLWAGDELGFQGEGLHLGGPYRVPVRVTEWVSDGEGRGPRTYAFSADLFDLPDGLPRLDAGAGFAGMRFLSSARRPDELAEFLVFHGASYFRGVGRSHGFGTSARAVALGTAEPAGEEFPAITHLVVERPEPMDRSLRVHALLESSSLTGVLSLVSTPGAELVMDADLVLFPRAELSSVGIAPLTSMFLFRSGTGRRFDDFRAAVHDAHGLQIVTGAGERLWRPLTNPGGLRVSSFMDEAPRGFGLMQRTRAFEAYSDLEARYERRPSVWVEPLTYELVSDSAGGGSGTFGPGAVMLVEIPTETEFNDNVVAFWRPSTPLAAGAEHRFTYRVRWCTSAPDEAELLRVVSTRSGLAPNSGRRLFIVDFGAPAEGASPAGGFGSVRIDASASSGTVLTRGAQLPGGGYRVTLEYQPGDDAKDADLSLRLMDADVVMSERWVQRWTR